MTDLVPVGNENIDQFIRRVMFKNIDPDALNITLLMCQRYDLDPLLKHVVVIRFGQRQSPYITRDGLLHVAHRSNELDGMSVSYGADAEGDNYAEATVWRKGHTHPFVYRAYASEYDTGQNVWKSHPKAMLGKTAEVIALRRAFDVAMNVVEEMDRVVVENGAEIIEGEVIPEAEPEQPDKPTSISKPAAPAVATKSSKTPEKGKNGAQDALAELHANPLWYIAVKYFGLAESLMDRWIADQPEGVNWGWKVYEICKGKLGYRDDNHVQETLGVESLKEFDGRLGEMLIALLDSAPQVPEA